MQASDTHFAMFPRDGRFFQRRWQNRIRWKETNIEEKQNRFRDGFGQPCAHVFCIGQAWVEFAAASACLVCRARRLLGHESRLRPAESARIAAQKSITNACSATTLIRKSRRRTRNCWPSRFSWGCCPKASIAQRCQRDPGGVTSKPREAPGSSARSARRSSSGEARAGPADGGVRAMSS